MVKMDQFMISMYQPLNQNDDIIPLDNLLFSEQIVSNVLREQSPFYHCFTQTANEIEDNPHLSMTTLVNPHYFPNFGIFLLKRYLYLFPLWTGSMLALSEIICGHTKIQTRETNSIVEKWMGIVKQNILQNKLHMPGDFLRKISQRISGFFFNIPKSSKKEGREMKLI